MAVFEMFKMDKEIESIILKNPTELDISRALRQKGMLTMKEDAMVKAFQKLIPFEEINKL
jgi:type II secretory ATPase GspE/PulE/Tfp pilus assembly ATPase PilB-like protein